MLSNILIRTLKYSRFKIGQYIGEIGGGKYLYNLKFYKGMERFGSKLSNDIAYTQILSRHRNIMQLDIHKPSVEYSWIAPNSTLVGEVYISSFASVWYNATLRAEYNPIRVGSYSSIGDGTVIHTHCAVPVDVPSSVTIGKYVTIQNNCTIYSCIIDDEVFIGAGSIIGEGCRIEKGAVIAPNTLVPPGKLIPGRQLWAGNPAKFVRDLKEEEVYSNYVHAFNVWNSAQTHLNNFNIEKTNDEIDIDPNSLVASYLSDNYFKWRSKFSTY